MPSNRRSDFLDHTTVEFENPTPDRQAIKPIRVIESTLLTIITIVLIALPFVYGRYMSDWVSEDQTLAIIGVMLAITAIIDGVQRPVTRSRLIFSALSIFAGVIFSLLLAASLTHGSIIVGFISVPLLRIFGAITIIITFLFGAGVGIFEPSSPQS